MSQQQPRQRHALHVVVPGRRCRRRTAAAAAARTRGTPPASRLNVCAAVSRSSRSSAARRPRSGAAPTGRRRERFAPRRRKTATIDRHFGDAVEAGLARDARRPARDPSSASRSRSENADSGDAAGQPPHRRRPRRPRRRPTTDARRSGARRRWYRPAATIGTASTCASNTRTNVVSSAVPLPAHLVGRCMPIATRSWLSRTTRRIGVPQPLALRQPLGDGCQRGHARHPFRDRLPVRLGHRRGLGVVAIFFGQGRVKPSLGHLRVASIPILLP